MDTFVLITPSFWIHHLSRSPASLNGTLGSEEIGAEHQTPLESRGKVEIGVRVKDRDERLRRP